MIPSSVIQRPNMIQVSDGLLAAHINPLGGAPASICLKNPQTGDMTEIMGQWPSSLGGMTSGFAMSPAVGALSHDGKVLHRGKIYEPGKHGFARKTPFICAEQTAQSTVMRLIHQVSETETVYPFPHQLDLVYRIENGSLLIDFSMLNLGNEDMYFGGGLHPAFLWPLPQSQTEEDHTITLLTPLPETTAFYLPVDGKVFADALDKSPFDKQGLWKLRRSDFDRDAYFAVWPEGACPTQSLLYQSASSPMRLRIDMTGWDGFGTWSKAGKNNLFLCFEPYVGVTRINRSATTPPAFHEIVGLRKLTAQALFHASMRITPTFA